MRSGIGRTLTLAGIFLGVWICGKLLFPLVFPFLLGTALATAAEPAVGFLRRRAGLPRELGAFIGVSATFLLLMLTLILLCAFVFRELAMLTSILPDLGTAAKDAALTTENWLLRLADRTPPAIRSVVQRGVNAVFTDSTALLDKGLNYFLGFAGSFLSHIPDSALTLGTAILSGYMISAKYPKLRRSFLRRLPRQKLRPVLEALRRIKNTVLRWLAAQLKLSGVTFAILLISFPLLRIPYAPLAALAVVAVDAFPVLGTGTVLLPWALISLLQGNTARAAGLAGIYVTVSVTRSVLEPKFLGKHLGLDPLAMLIALYAGYRLWGIGGMLLSPILAVTALQFLPPRGETP